MVGEETETGCHDKSNSDDDYGIIVQQDGEQAYLNVKKDKDPLCSKGYRDVWAATATRKHNGLELNDRVAIKTIYVRTQDGSAASQSSEAKSGEPYCGPEERWRLAHQEICVLNHMGRKQRHPNVVGYFYTWIEQDNKTGDDDETATAEGTGQSEFKGTHSYPLVPFHSRYIHSSHISWPFTLMLYLRNLISFPPRAFSSHLFAVRTVNIVMELYERGTLEYLLKMEKNLECAETFPLIINIADAVDYLHSNRYIHRDIKPANILLRRDDHGYTAVLADLGLCVEYKEGGVSRAGTKPYCSYPEKKAEFASDVWMLGYTMAEMILSASRQGRYLPQSKGRLLDVLSGVDECYEDIVEIIGLCLQGESTLRPTARDLVRYLSFQEIESIKDLLESTGVTVQELLSTSRAIAEQLVYLHNKHYVLKDFTPSNIIYCKSAGDIVEVRLNLKPRKKASIYTSYPEEGEDMRSNIWSFGMVLLEMASSPYRLKDNRSASDWMDDLARNPEMIRSRIEDALMVTDSPGRRIREIISQCLNADPQRRPTADELLTDLNSISKNE